MLIPSNAKTITPPLDGEIYVNLLHPQPWFRVGEGVPENQQRSKYILCGYSNGVDGLLSHEERHVFCMDGGDRFYIAYKCADVSEHCVIKDDLIIFPVFSPNTGMYVARPYEEGKIPYIIDLKVFGTCDDLCICRSGYKMIVDEDGDNVELLKNGERIRVPVKHT